MNKYTTMRECLMRDIHDLEDQRDFAMSEMERRGCERDKARDTVFRLRKQRAIARKFGEQMERDRDEARRDLEEEMKFHHRTHGECVIAQCELMDVKKERDEAREAFAIATNNCVDAQQRLRELNEAREDAKRATYDAAQETIKVSAVKSHWIEACRERDEAREALREIASLQRYEHKFWDDGDGQIDESEREKADGMYLLHAQVSKILTRVLK